MFSILDTTGPFFVFNTDEVTNWSKIPFHDFENNGVVEIEKLNIVEAHFDTLLLQAKKLNINALSFDDLPHITSFGFYPQDLQQRLHTYISFYKKLFSKAHQQGFSIFINADIASENKYIQKYYKAFEKDYSDVILKMFTQACDVFPEITGVILRVGESDGNDVEGDFKSKLRIKTPAQANDFLKKLLPVFEEKEKYCIFRTWTVGAYEIGDLAWNEKTYQKVFGDIESDYLIISMKYGESDFYRFHQKILNPLFFTGRHKKILELQTRREREGFGQHPFYIGWEYEIYLEQAKLHPHFFGISVWAQTGGWSRHKNITYIQNSSLWNELNTFATLELFHENTDAETAIGDFFQSRENAKEYDIEIMKVFLRQYRDLFVSLLYIKGYSDTSFYFRRLRLPPLLWIFWDHIVISPLIALVCEINGGKIDIPNRRSIDHVCILGKRAGVKDMTFQQETFLAFRSARLLLAGQGEDRHQKCIAEYEEKYPGIYHFTLPDDSPMRLRILQKILSFLLRKTPHYRWIDHVIFSKWGMKAIYFVSGKIFKKHMPSFINKQCMDIETVIIT